MQSCRDCREEFESLNEVGDGGMVCDTCLQEDYEKCPNCNALEHADTFVTTGRGEQICDPCIQDCYLLCNHCGEYYHYDDLCDNLCEGCFEENCFTCDECGAVEPNEYLHLGYRNGRVRTICSICRDDEYFYCAGCEEVVHRRHHTSDGFCSDCDNERVIKPWDYQPGRFFYYHKGEERARYLGVELEIDKGGGDDNKAEELTSMLGGEDQVYAKHDGSLNDGFELVTHPMTLKYIKSLPWEEMFERAIEMGYRSHDPQTAGIHVHIGRVALGGNIIEQERAIGALLFIFERHWKKIVKFSRRTKQQVDEWANRYVREDLGESADCPEEILMLAKRRMGKYYAINLSHSTTIEMRIFRGSLRYKTFMATIEFCDSLAELVVNTPIEEIQMMTWDQLIDKLSVGTEYLDEYFKYRELDIEEPEEPSHTTDQTEPPAGEVLEILAREYSGFNQLMEEFTIAGDQPDVELPPLRALEGRDVFQSLWFDRVNAFRHWAEDPDNIPRAYRQDFAPQILAMSPTELGVVVRQSGLSWDDIASVWSDAMRISRRSDA